MNPTIRPTTKMRSSLRKECCNIMDGGMKRSRPTAICHLGSFGLADISDVLGVGGGAIHGRDAARNGWKRFGANGARYVYVIYE